MSSVPTPSSRPSKASARKPKQPVAEARAAPRREAAEAGHREAMIRIAAYAFSERRGFAAGHELDDWLQAEMEVDRQLAAARESPAR